MKCITDRLLARALTSRKYSMNSYYTACTKSNFTNVSRDRSLRALQKYRTAFFSRRYLRRRLLLKKQYETDSHGTRGWKNVNMKFQSVHNIIPLELCCIVQYENQLRAYFDSTQVYMLGIHAVRGYLATVYDSIKHPRNVFIRLRGRVYFRRELTNKIVFGIQTTTFSD